MSYAYEQGKSERTHLLWDDASGRLEPTGAAAWTAPDKQIVKVVR
jgi:alpha-D-xyloside xylohydrolase